MRLLNRRRQLSLIDGCAPCCSLLQPPPPPPLPNLHSRRTSTYPLDRSTSPPSTRPFSPLAASLPPSSNHLPTRYGSCPSFTPPSYHFRRLNSWRNMLAGRLSPITASYLPPPLTHHHHNEPPPAPPEYRLMTATTQRRAGKLSSEFGSGGRHFNSTGESRANGRPGAIMVDPTTAGGLLCSAAV